MDGYKYRKNEKGVYLPVGEEDGVSANYGLVQRSVSNLVRKVTPLKKTRNISINISFL